MRNSTASPSIQQPQSQPHININSLKDLLSEFHGDGSEFRRWRDQFNLVKATYKLDDDLGRLLLGSKLKGKALRWFHSKSEFVGMTVDNLMIELTSMFDHRQDRMTSRRKFEQRTWMNSESFSDYFHDKLILANTIPVVEEELLDYLVDGIPDLSLRNQARIQKFKDKSDLLTAFDKVSLKDESRLVNEVKNDLSKDITSQAAAKEKIPSRSATSPPRCFNCSKIGHMAVNCRLPKRPLGACFKCFELGHQSKDCTNKRMQLNKNQVSNVMIEHSTRDVRVHSNTCSDQTLVLDDNDKDNTLDKQCFRIISYKFDNGGEGSRVVSLATLLDTGSPISFIRISQLPSENIQPCTAGSLPDYSGINNSILKILGITSTKVRFNNIEHKIEIFVVPDETMQASVILGRDVLSKFNLGLMALPYEEAEAVREIFAIDHGKNNLVDSMQINPAVDFKVKLELKKIFTTEYLNKKRPEFPKIKMELSIKLTSEKSIMFGPRRLSFEEKVKLQILLDDLIARKIIRESDAKYASPIVLTRKKNGDIRLCIDYRFLNKITECLNYPFPLIEDLVDSLRDKYHFTLFDLKDGFHHVDVAEESIKYTAFITPLGHFEFLKMPFGLKTAPATFQKFINKIFSDLIRSGDLELRMDKCRFLQSEIEYLGYKVSAGGISPNERGVDAIKNFPVPSNIREVQSFLGMCAYFRKFVLGFSMIAKPLYDLLKKNVEFVFGESQFQAFENLK